jgi:hypothetical protein
MSWSITSALVCGAVLGMWFPITRWMAISCAAALCFFYPWMGIVAVSLVAWSFYYFHIRK